MNDISKLYQNLLKQPNAITVYRGLRDYYHNKGMKNESLAFACLLRERYADITDFDTESRKDNSTND